MRMSKRMRMPERTMGVLIGKETISKRHAYTPINDDIPLPEKLAALNKRSFGMELGQASIDLKGICTTSPSPSYYSPGASNIGETAADLHLIAELFRNPSIDVTKTMLGCVANPKHCILLRKNTNTETWFMPLTYFPRSAAILWPVKVVESMPGKFVADPETLMVDPWITSITCWADWEAWAGGWTSWSAQLSAATSSCKVKTPAIRFVLAGTHRPLLQEAAHAAFWNLSHTEVTFVAEAHGLSTSKSASLYETLKSVIGQVLDKTDAEVVPILARRLLTLQPDAQMQAELLEVEEAADHLDKSDLQELNKTKDEAKTLAEQFTSFASQLREHSASLAPLPVAPAAKAKKGKTKNAAPAKLRLPMTGHIETKDARMYTPPGATIWQSRLDHAWRGKVGEFMSISRSWVRYGETRALYLVVRECWVKHCQLNGIAPENCPVQGVFADTGDE
eukprot:6461939-Amphidinium_carterae.2